MATEQLRWGVSPLCWTNDVLEDLGGDIPLDTCLREAREAGYQGIELGRKFPRQAATLGPLLAAADLRLASGWYSGMLADRSVEAELEAVREHAQLLRQLGAKVMVYGECGQLPGETPLDEPISLSPPLSRVSLAAYCHKLNTFADLLLRDYDLQLAYHHHLMIWWSTMTSWSGFCLTPMTTSGWRLIPGTPLSPGSRSRSYCTNMATVSAICI